MFLYQVKDAIRKQNKSGSWKNHDLELLLNNPVCINVKNIREWMWGPNNENKRYAYGKDYPYVLSPFEVTWTEFDAEDDINGVNVKSQFGLLIISSDLGKDNKEKRWRHDLVGFSFFDKLNRPEPLIDYISGYYINSEGGYSGGFDLNNQDRICSIVPQQFDYHSKNNDQVISNLLKGLRDGGLVSLPPTLFAFTFLHCKNVHLNTKNISDKQQIKWRKKGHDYPLIEFKTICVDRIKSEIQSRTGEKYLSEKAFHLCRGHFKSFNEHPLFGRHKGTYFWPMHVRGNKENGEIIKDYEVSKPNNIAVCGRTS